MNSHQALSILDKSWSKEKFLEKIKKGQNSDQIVQDFIKENKETIDILIKLIDEKDRELLGHMETLTNCESKLINELKLKEFKNNTNYASKNNEQNSILKTFKEFRLSIFMNKWSNKFVIGLLIMISLLSLTKQAWA